MNLVEGLLDVYNNAMKAQVEVWFLLDFSNTANVGFIQKSLLFMPDEVWWVLRISAESW